MKQQIVKAWNFVVEHFWQLVGTMVIVAILAHMGLMMKMHGMVGIYATTWELFLLSILGFGGYFIFRTFKHPEIRFIWMVPLVFCLLIVQHFLQMAFDSTGQTELAKIITLPVRVLFL